MPVADFEPVIGLEVHAQLLTRTKIFCGCSTQFGAPPNTHVCPVCLGLPGALPALNKAAVEMAIKAGKAFGCKIAARSVWARKNYFYPDLPKGYQISQYELPICAGGAVPVPGLGKVGLERIHLEEDAGKNVHAEAGSEVDLNRSGVPLIEIVGKPELRSAEDASEYLKALRLALIYLGVNDGNLEEGSFRCDANVSVRRKGAEKLGTRVELKNINSFRFVRQAIEYEIGRQVEAIEGGGRVVQETRLFDHEKGVSRAMRSKEEANDYRYFPEPDLAPLLVSEEWKNSVSVPRLPQEVTEDLIAAGVSAADARTIVGDPRLVEVHRRVGGDSKRAALFVVGELLRAVNEKEADPGALRFDPALVREVFRLQDAGTISSTAAREVLAELIRTGKAPQTIVEEKGLAQVSDNSALESVVDAVLAKNPGEVEKYKAGKTNLLGFFVGQAMKDLKGKGNPGILNGLFKKKLGG
ncbi:MAG TPA: Asp-tRNA(Asn)/Glu-tRNA(Gln) amidotransferase subunit GatB [Myxococcales bacterium]|jgi:aspartyl-tRNA(Asn)/glutamyl-tRNA(Gln) amidotransferase subunit B|nr:Asp-tRNA(Asn)/Glu-tRNA(Gln) amidotransferase subunit GatB [Myxococcales bacterium]